VLVVTALAIGSRLADWWWPESDAAALRARAERALQDGRLSMADGSGARELYEAALALQPDQVEAREGLARVARAALADARAKAAAGQAAQARIALRLARELQAPQAGIDAVEASLRDGEAGRASIDALLDRAEAARAAGRLDGDDAAALPLYRRVLALSPRNQRAVEGREDALADLLRPAHAALVAGDLGTAMAVVRRAEAYDPGHADLPVLRAGVARLLEQAAARVQRDVRAGRLAQAEAACRRLLDSVPDVLPATCSGAVVDGLLAQARRQAEAGDARAVLASMAQAERLAPGDPRLREARQLLRNAHREEAVADPARIRDAHALLATARAAQARGDWLTPPGDSAWDALRAARALAPRDPAVVAASRAIGMAARDCFEQALRDTRLGEAGNCLDAWRQLDPDGSRRAEARHRLAQRWLAFGDERLQAVDLVRQRAVAIDIAGEVVLERALRVLDAGLDQADDLRFAGVQAEFLAAGGDVDGDLTPLEFLRRQHVAGRDVQHVVAGVAQVGGVRGVVQRLDDGQAAVFVPRHALAHHATIQGVVLGHVVLDVLPVLAEGRGHQFGEGAIRGNHVGAPWLGQ